jgi:hypothetical protein
MPEGMPVGCDVGVPEGVPVGRDDEGREGWGEIQPRASVTGETLEGILAGGAEAAVRRWLGAETRDLAAAAAVRGRTRHALCSARGHARFTITLELGHARRRREKQR